MFERRSAFDISDALNPVLIKELRQGLKSRAFASAFLIMQALMVLSICIHVFALNTNSGAEAAGIFFWVFAGAPLLIVLPLLAVNAIYSEQKQMTLPLVLLTRLTPWRMVTGKWAALMAQCALITCAVLPYVVLRYFLGGIHVAKDLFVLAMFVSGSGVLCAGGLLLSTVKKPWTVMRYFALALIISPLALGLALPYVFLFIAVSARPDLIPLQFLLGAIVLLHWTASRYTDFNSNERAIPRVTTCIVAVLLIGCIQVAAKFAPVHIALPLLIPGAMWSVERTAAFIWPDAPARRRTLGACALVGALTTFCLLTQPLPGPGPLYFFATLIAAIAAPLYVVFSIRRWIEPPQPFFFMAEFILMLVAGVFIAAYTEKLVHIPSILQSMPVSSFLLAALDKGEPAALKLNIVIAAISLLGVLRVTLKSEIRSTKSETSLENQKA